MFLDKNVYVQRVAKAVPSENVTKYKQMAEQVNVI